MQWIKKQISATTVAAGRIGLIAAALLIIGIVVGLVTASWLGTFIAAVAVMIIGNNVLRRSLTERIAETVRASRFH